MENNRTQVFTSDVVFTGENEVSISGEPGIKQATPGPLTGANRIQTIDLIRGFALLGILLMNIPPFGIDYSVYNTVLNGSHTDADYISMATMYVFFEGTMRGLFSMLFGAGMILFTSNKKELPGGVTVAEYYYRRLLWLVLFGIFNAYVLLWFGDILFFYGLAGMLLYSFRKSQPRLLLVLGIACMAINAFITINSYNETREKRTAYLEARATEKAHKKLSEKQQQATTEWLEIEKTRTPDADRLATNNKSMNGGYVTVFNYMMPRNSRIESSDTYFGVWDILCMMFIGMALYAIGFFSNQLSSSAYIMFLLIGYGVGLPLSWIYFKGFTLWVSMERGAYVDAFSVQHFVLYDLKRLFLCVGHASLILLLFRSRIVPWLMKALANVGQMAFTNYLMQSIICAFIFYGFGLDYYDKLRFYQLYYIVAGVWVLQLIYSPIWLRYFLFGPFEWLWRSLTYWKIQPMRIKKSKVDTM